MEYTKWVACFGTATSITDRSAANYAKDRQEAVYAKDITLRYPVRMVFDANKIRIHFSNLTGTEPVTLSKVTLLKDNEFTELTFNGNAKGVINAGEELLSDEIEMNIKAMDEISVSIYLGDFTQMNAGTLVTGPLSKGQFAYGDFSTAIEFPKDCSRDTNWYYFLNTIDVFTCEENRALVCYGDSITAQSWPDYLAIRAYEEGYKNIAIIRRAVCGTRILRQYDCAAYAAYGLKGATRFPVELDTAGVSAVIIQHGINDIIHPVGVEVNEFRPWEDMPTTRELIEGFTDIYITHAKYPGLKVYGGTLLPIYGWRTYADFREKIRTDFNAWLKTTEILDGCVDFDQAVRDESFPERFKDGFDSGDHLHPSENAYKAMAYAVPLELF